MAEKSRVGTLSAAEDRPSVTEYSRYYFPQEALRELADDVPRFADVRTFKDFASEARRKLIKGDVPGSPTYAGMTSAIMQSRWGGVIRFLQKRDILDSETPFQLHPVNNMLPALHKVRTFSSTKEAVPDRGGPDPISGLGYSRSRITEALSKAVGEHLERHALRFENIARSDLRRRIFADSKFPPGLFHQLPKQHKWQLKYFPGGLTKSRVDDLYRDPGATLWSVPVRKYGSPLTFALPTQLVGWGGLFPRKFGPYDVANEGCVVGTHTTNGGGAGFSVAEALSAAVRELIERDGFLINWLNGLSPDRIIIDTSSRNAFSPDFIEAHDLLRIRGHQVYFLDTTTDVGVPSCVCVTIGPGHGDEPFINLSGGCHPRPELALRSALFENISVRNALLVRDAPFALSPNYLPFSDINISKLERLRLWRGESMSEKFSFFVSGKEMSFENWRRRFKEAPPLDDHQHVLALCAEGLSALSTHDDDYSIYYHEATNPVLRELGYHVVRAVVPPLVPLYLLEPAAPLDAKRLREVPKKLGRTPLASSAYTPYPHPFP